MFFLFQVLRGVTLPHNVFVFLCYFQQLLVSERHHNFQEYAESFEKHRTVSTFLKLSTPPGGIFFNILRRISYNITKTAQNVLKCGLRIESGWGETFYYLNLESFNFLKKTGTSKENGAFSQFFHPNYFHSY